jgi:hypothetical protein
MKLFRLLIYSFLSAVFFTAFIYNADVVVTLMVNFFHIRMEPLDSIPLIPLHVITTVFYFFSFLFAYKKFSQKNSIVFICIIIPAILIDLSVPFTGRELMPLRFPFATLFPIFGALGGWIKIKREKIFFYSYVVFIAIFLFLSKQLFIPRIIYFMENRDSRKTYAKGPYGQGYLLTLDGKEVRLEDTVKGCCALLEFYFTRCGACEEKLPTLKELKNKIASADFKIIMVCDGSISSYKQFTENAQKHKDPAFIYLYDQFGMEAKFITDALYPYEVIVNRKGGIVSTHIGYNPETAAYYLNDNFQRIKTILND